jgi:peptidoglycan lytic transglycosylase D
MTGSRCTVLLFMVWTLLILLAVTINTAIASEPQTVQSSQQQSSASYTSHPTDIWARIRSGFKLKGFDSRAVRHHEILYTRHPKYIHRIIKRSKPYLYHIVEEVEHRGMPTEIVLLPLVESAFDPRAKSKSNALGLWQFIPATGDSYGLMRNKWYDDRKDILAATRAALDYLQKLHMIFGDWKLALAAYNWGKTAVRRSLASSHQKGQPASFQHIELPSETRNHVYKLIAVRNIVAAPEKFGVTLDAIPDQPYFAEIKIRHTVNISQITKLANISIDEFNALNPAYNRGVIKIEDTPRILLVPIEKKETFFKNLKFYNRVFRPWRIFLAQNKPDTVESSRPHEIILTHLGVINDIKRDENMMPTSQMIPVPSRKRDIGANANIVRKKPVASNIVKRSENNDSENALTYIVKKGDTLYAIARQHGLTVTQIKYWNNNDENLSIGQELILMPDSPTVWR